MTYFSQLSRGCLAEYFLARSAKLKGLAGSSGISAVFGITEPAIFGVNLRLRWPFYVGMGAASIGAMLVAIFDVKAMALGAAGFIGVGELRAPLDGKVAVTFPSGHAYAIRGTGKDGKPVDVLMHIGFDTVNLKGEHFTPHVKKGDEVRAGDCSPPLTSTRSSPLATRSSPRWWCRTASASARSPRRLHCPRSSPSVSRALT